MKIQQINPEDISVNTTEDDIQDLIESIRKNGFLPGMQVTVQLLWKGKYKVINGNRRILACQHLGLETIPCIVIER